MKIFTTFARKIFIPFLAWLLHHANRKFHNPEFYAIKNRLLKKYGVHLCYDVQFIEGKKCRTCAGTGIYSKHYDSYGFVSDVNDCWNCDGTGWYKLPVWNILTRLQFGKYTFHQPYQRSYKKPDTSIPIIEGYIDHDASKYSDFAAIILFLMYEKGYLKQIFQGAFKSLKRHLSRYKYKLRVREYSVQGFNCELIDDLPF